MKINTTGLHPLFDQYSNDENRLTHALLHTIASSRWLLANFLKKFIGINYSFRGSTFQISTQKVPFSQQDLDPPEIDSVPDGWIVDEASNLGIVIEVKDIKNSKNTKQLKSHIKRVKKYQKPYLFIVTPDLKEPQHINALQENQNNVEIVWRSWDQTYRWLKGLQVLKSANKNKVQFLIESMLDYLELRREVLGFQGIFFRNNEFNVDEAKDILNAEMEELESTVRKLYPDLTNRRPAITKISNVGVWDCFGVKEGFTNDLHFTIGINEKCQDIALTIPNSAKKAWTQLKKIFSDDKLENELSSLLRPLRGKVPHIFIEFNQRHFIARRFGVNDGIMEFNIDTIGTSFRGKNSKTKEFPIWYPALKSAILNKGKVNAQVKFKSRFYLKETKGIDKPEFLKTATKTLETFKPLYTFLRNT